MTDRPLVSISLSVQFDRSFAGFLVGQRAVRDQCDIDPAQRRLRGGQHCFMRGMVGGIHGMGKYLLRAAHPQIGGNIVQPLDLAPDQKQRSALRRPLPCCRFGNRRGGAYDQNPFHLFLHDTPPEAGRELRVDKGLESLPARIGFAEHRPRHAGILGGIEPAAGRSHDGV